MCGIYLHAHKSLTSSSNLVMETADFSDISTYQLHNVVLHPEYICLHYCVLITYEHLKTLALYFIFIKTFFTKY